MLAIGMMAAGLPLLVHAQAGTPASSSAPAVTPAPGQTKPIEPSPPVAPATVPAPQTLLTSPRVFRTPQARFPRPSRFGFALSTNALSPLQFGPSITAEGGLDVGVVIRYMYPPKGLVAQKVTDPASIDRGYGISAGVRWYLSGRPSVQGFYVGANALFVVVEGTYMNQIPAMYGQEATIDGYLFRRELFIPHLDLGYRWVFLDHLMIGVGGAVGFAFTTHASFDRFDGSLTKPVDHPPLPFSEITLDVGGVY